METLTMDHYVGLDISLEETSVCIVNNDGNVIRETKVQTDPDALAKELVAQKLDLKRVGLEASSQGGWLHAELSRRGFPTIVVEAAICAPLSMPSATKRIATMPVVSPR
jgi:transposase